MAINGTTERYIDRYKVMSGKEMVETDVLYKNAPNDAIQDAIKLLTINQSYLRATKLTESAAMFYLACPDIKELIPEEFREDIFYSIRLGYKMKGVPSKLVVLLQKAKEIWEYPNVALSTISFSEIACFSSSLENNLTLTDVVNNIWKSDVKIMSPYRKKVDHSTYTEMYVENKKQASSSTSLFDTVVIVPKDVSDLIGDADIANVFYNEEKGLMLNDIVLRTMNGRFGITVSDIDMRGSF